MSRTVAEKKDFTFVGGLNTEAGFQTFPENAWLDGVNMTPHIDGSITRRTKLDLEANFQLSSRALFDADKDQFALTVHRWDSAGGNGETTLIVIQQGDELLFYGNSQASISLDPKLFSVDLNTYDTGTGPGTFGSSPVQTSFGNGKMVVVSEQIDPILVEYDPVGDSITVTRLTLKIRDFDGVEDNLDPDERPTSLSAEHHYNLLNQGWTDTNITSYHTTDTPFYPSNAQIWTEGKDATDVFSPAQLDKQFFGTSLAPRGHFILDVFNRDRSTVSGVGGITTETELSRPKTTAFFAGRAWYSGVNSTDIGSWVMFSQIVTNDNKKYQQCYQSGDPTAEFTSDLIASDGGVIPIPDAGDITRLVPIQDSLLVFAQNGVWQIDGGASGFAADVYHVHKVCPFGCFAPETIVETEAGIIYWSVGDIYILKRGNLASGTGDFVVESLSFNKIQTLYSDISTISKQRAQGFYDIESKKIFWLFSDNPQQDTGGTVTDAFRKDKMLIFDTRLGAFYVYSFIQQLPTDPIYIFGGIQTIVSSGSTTNDLDVIVTSGDTVIVTSGDTVFSGVQFSSGQISSRVIKFATIVNDSGLNLWKVSFSDFTNTLDAPEKFQDWFSYNGVGIEQTPLPFLLTGWATGGDGTKKHQSPYIIMFMKRTETGFDDQLQVINESSCILQGRWEWTDDPIAGHWSRAQEVYRHIRAFSPAQSSTYNDGYPLVVTKNKLRGQGRALSLKFSASSGKDMQLVGWSVLYNANTQV